MSNISDLLVKLKELSINIEKLEYLLEEIYSTENNDYFISLKPYGNFTYMQLFLNVSPLKITSILLTMLVIISTITLI